MDGVVRAVLVAALCAVACGGAPRPAGAPAPSTAAATPAAGSPSSRLEGTVQSATPTRLTLVDGTSFEVSATTRILRTDPATASDLKAGLFVAITAKRQPDDSLLASMVSIFSESLSRTVPAGQRPLPEGNLMTNAAIAAIDQVSGASFSVTFPGGTAKVVLAPGAVILKQVDVRPDDIRAGTRITAVVLNGVAQSIQIQAR